MSDELDKSEGDNGEDGTAGAERPTVSPPFDPAAFARDVLAKPSPARGIPAVGPDAHTHATPPQGMAAQAAAVELSRASKPPTEEGSSPDASTGGESERKTADQSLAPTPMSPPVVMVPPPSPATADEPTPDSIRSIAAQRLPSHEVPRIDVPPKKHDSLEFNAVDREWADLEVATRPPPADAPDEDPVIEFSHDPGGVVNLDLDDIDPLPQESPTAKRAKLPSMTEEALTAPAAIIAEAPAPAPVPTPSAGPAEAKPSKKPPPGEREMNDRVSVGDYSGALEIAEAILAEKPQDKAARECAEQCRQVLRKMYAARIGPLDRVPSVAVARDQLRWLSIDHKAGFVLSLVDGVSSLEMIIDVSGMPELDTLRILSELAQQRIISLR